jgi:hypothetical protein
VTAANPLLDDSQLVFSNRSFLVPKLLKCGCQKIYQGIKCNIVELAASHSQTWLSNF